MLSITTHCRMILAALQANVRIPRAESSLAIAIVRRVIDDGVRSEKMAEADSANRLQENMGGVTFIDSIR